MALRVPSVPCAARGVIIPAQVQGREEGLGKDSQRLSRPDPTQVVSEAQRTGLASSESWG